MSKPTIYLAGPISGMTYKEGTSWRDYVCGKMPSCIGVASPLRNKSYLNEIGQIAANDAYPGKALSADSGVMTRDRFDVANSALVFMNLLGAKAVSIGTMIEVGWCDAYRKPLVLCMEKSGNLHEHPMLRQAVGFRTDNLDEAIEICKSVLMPYMEVSSRG